MKVIGVIPARWGSSRFEGKVLAPIAGKPMIQHVWERASQAKKLEEIIIACDDQRIMDAVESFGAKAVMTSEKHTSGTDRAAEAVQGIDCEVVVNVQGDEPLIEPKLIDELADACQMDRDCSMATVIKACSSQDELNDPNVVKVTIDSMGHAMYFSRVLIPYNRDKADVKYFKHLGVYAYKKNFLTAFTRLPKTPLECAEKLEQLRALESGFKIKTIQTNVDTLGVDTPGDVAKVEAILSEGKLHEQ